MNSPCICQQCGDSFIAKRRAKFCSNKCGAKASYERRRDAGQFTRPTHLRTCEWCKTEWLATSGNARFCSFTCSNAFNYPPSKRRVQRSARWKAAERRLRKAARGTTGKKVIWTQGRCNRCGDSFTSRTSAGALARYCSRTCKHADIHERRRARMALVEVEKLHRRQIFERDNYRCHICKKPTKRDASAPHPLAPTLDHIIPIALGGPHTRTNVATAHFLCNSTKSNRLAGDQLALIG